MAASGDATTFVLSPSKMSIETLGTSTVETCTGYTLTIVAELPGLLKAGRVRLF